MIKVIVKIEKYIDGKERPILFLPNTHANIGTIACYSPHEGHTEACIGYYHKCKHASDKEAKKWCDWYYNLGDDKTPVKRAYKQSPKDRTEAYSWL